MSAVFAHISYLDGCFIHTVQAHTQIILEISGRMQPIGAFSHIKPFDELNINRVQVC